MICSKCRSKTKVIDSRIADSTFHRRRRRYECLGCGERFSTVEIPVETYDTIMDQVLKLVKIERHMKDWLS